VLFHENYTAKNTIFSGLRDSFPGVKSAPAGYGFQVFLIISPSGFFQKIYFGSPRRLPSPLKTEQNTQQRIEKIC
jgi:hypothetical protein